ncbi:GRAS transcription factor [Heracleum sosnowskyi]|uniref:GRAS transcription factor n=1 Tax=Heracleum sosnowskyi TaxID=360622 RepID=A0AAD8IT66_9APIA|nr:GRAS transcription factor [Heracleum sosnowskyi]
MEEMFFSEQRGSRLIPDEYGHSKGYCNMEEKNTEIKTLWYGTKEFVETGDINLLHQNNTIQENISFSSKRKFSQADCEQFNLASHSTTGINATEKLATKDFLRLGGETFIQSTSAIVDSLSSGNPSTTSLCGLSDEERRDVEIIQHLLASAEKVGEQQFSRANNLLNHCHEYSSNKGTSVQRLVYYFSAALQQKIEHETGRTRTGTGKMQSLALKDTLMNPDPSVLAYYQKVPFSQVILFTAMQAMTESLSVAKKIHIIDLEIRNGLHYTFLMEALAARSDCPLEHLKITAVGTISKHKIEQTGKRLMSVAQSLNLRFSFDVVIVADMQDLNESLFSLNAEEKLAVYSPYILSFMIESPARLETLMTVIQKLNPCIMVVAEVEANHNSPVFVNRFIEALFYYGAFFDSMEECMDRDDPNRMMSESIALGPAITNIVVFEGEERIIRHVNSNVWKAFFSRFGIVETELSSACLYQAKLLVDNFACASSCTFEMVGKSLAIGWKGTPMLSVSALKFL